MFTGIIQSTGRIVSRAMQGGSGRLTVESDREFSRLEYGESIAVNGACLTLERFQGRELVFHVLEESFRRTNLGLLPPGSAVNLERAMKADGRFGGHIVTGHVDVCGSVLSLGQTGSDMELTVEAPEGIRSWLVPKGSICLDGVSLTIASLERDRFSVRIIPVTWKETAIRFRNRGDAVNLEADLIGKYVAHQLEERFGPAPSASPSGSEKKELTMQDLREAGF